MIAISTDGNMCILFERPSARAAEASYAQLTPIKFKYVGRRPRRYSIALARQYETCWPKPSSPRLASKYITRRWPAMLGPYRAGSAS